VPSERSQRDALQRASRGTAETFILAETTDSRKRSSRSWKIAHVKQSGELCIFRRLIAR
jgi:hypothetical protein